MTLRLAVFLACLALGSGAAHASCPDWLAADMAERGVPQREIARMCGPPALRSLSPSLAAPPAPAAALAPAPAPAPAPRATGPSNRCVPGEGTACETRTARPVGSPCWCFTAEGDPVSGTIR